METGSSQQGVSSCSGANIHRCCLLPLVFNCQVLEMKTNTLKAEKAVFRNITATLGLYLKIIIVSICFSNNSKVLFQNSV